MANGPNSHRKRSVVYNYRVGDLVEHSEPFNASRRNNRNVCLPNLQIARFQTPILAY
jgi:hypothetical protein